MDVYGDLEVLNHDVRLENFIVRPDESVVMIDFAQARVRRQNESDRAWNRAKASRDEEGAVGWVTRKRFGWAYTPTGRYVNLETDEETDEE